MATPTLERIYTIPLRLAAMKVPHYKRARKGIVTIKEFIAHHMKVPHRDVNNVKLDMYLNNELWSRGSHNTPPRVTVKATKTGDIVHVTFAETPKHIGFMKSKHDRMHKKADKKADAPKKEIADVKSEEEKKAESEKEQSVALANEKLAEQQAKDVKHTTKAKTPEIRRMSLKK